MPKYQAYLCNDEVLQQKSRGPTSYADAILRDTDMELAEPDDANILLYGGLVCGIILFLVIVALLCRWWSNSSPDETYFS